MASNTTPLAPGVLKLPATAVPLLTLVMLKVSVGVVARAPIFWLTQAM
jgi:hypothetical protein